jgi:hypothetical protein
VGKFIREVGITHGFNAFEHFRLAVELIHVFPGDVVGSKGHSQLDGRQPPVILIHKPSYTYAAVILMAFPHGADIILVKSENVLKMV